MISQASIHLNRAFRIYNNLQNAETGANVGEGGKAKDRMFISVARNKTKYETLSHIFDSL